MENQKVFVSGIGICEVVEVLGDDRIVLSDLSISRLDFSRVHVSKCLHPDGPEARAVQNLVEKTYLEVQGIGRVLLLQECGGTLIVEDESGTRLSLPASRCVGYTFGEGGEVSGMITPPPADPASLDDQFTGADMGAEMAAAEGFNHSQMVAEPGDQVFTVVGKAVVEWVVETPGGWVYGIKSLNCPDPRLMVLLGDEFTVTPLPSAAYRVGDAHVNGEA